MRARAERPGLGRRSNDRWLSDITFDRCRLQTVTVRRPAHVRRRCTLLLRRAGALSDVRGLRAVLGCGNPKQAEVSMRELSLGRQRARHGAASRIRSPGTAALVRHVSSLHLGRPPARGVSDSRPSSSRGSLSEDPPNVQEQESPLPPPEAEQVCPRSGWVRTGPRASPLRNLSHPRGRHTVPNYDHSRGGSLRVASRATVETVEAAARQHSPALGTGQVSHGPGEPLGALTGR